jgi:hypothetical protein
MKKLHLDGLKVDSFTTTRDAGDARGTVAAHATGQCTYRDCPYSWDGTCWVTCWDSCYCETEFEC